MHYAHIFNGLVILTNTFSYVIYFQLGNSCHFTNFKKLFFFISVRKHGTVLFIYLYFLSSGFILFSLSHQRPCYLGIFIRPFLNVLTLLSLIIFIRIETSILECFKCLPPCNRDFTQYF